MEKLKQLIQTLIGESRNAFDDHHQATLVVVNYNQIFENEFRKILDNDCQSFIEAMNTNSFRQELVRSYKYMLDKLEAHSIADQRMFSAMLTYQELKNIDRDRPSRVTDKLGACLRQVILDEERVKRIYSCNFSKIRMMMPLLEQEELTKEILEDFFLGL
jgi:hypothetical protein